jgi:hypothetical protein
MELLAGGLSFAHGGALLFTMVLVGAVLIAGLLFYALREKGDVKAQLSFRPFRLTLEAKDRIRTIPRIKARRQT